MIELIDSHTHIYAEDFEQDIEEVLERGRQAGVQTLILPNVDVESYPRMMALAARYPEYLHPCLGLHPTSVSTDYREQLQELEAALRQHSFVAIGEIGLDYYWDTSFKQEQIDAFERQLALAEQYKLPVIIHTRSAWDDTIATLKRVRGNKVRGVFHCFSGSQAELEEALSFEHMMIGIGGVVTFKNSTLREFITRLPIDRLLLETDSPYLSPVPKRGRRNEPAHLVYVLHCLAESYGISPETLARETTNNAKRLFDLV